MKNKYLMLVLLLGLSGVFTIQGCQKDESPTPVVYQAFTTPGMGTLPAADNNGIVLFTGSTVDLVWASTGATGATQSWTVNFGTSDPPKMYKDKLTSTKLTVPVLDGKTYFYQVVISDANGIKTTSEVYKFTTVNGLNPHMTVGLTTTTDAKTSIGADLTPDKVVDLRLFVLKKSDMSVVTIINSGKSSENYSGFDALPDGDYVLGVDINSTINAGDINAPVNLSLALQFNQLGLINQKLDFPNVMTNANPCSLFRTYLANVTKVGATYTIQAAISYMKPTAQTIWTGTDDAYPSQVKTVPNCTGGVMTGLTFGWMFDYWGEIIVSGGTCSYTISGNAITIPLQKYCKTTYKGAAQSEYSISGTGTITTVGGFPVYTINYILYQGGKTILTTGNGVPAGYLQAVITHN